MSAKNEHDMLCGGMYIKLFGKDQFDQHHFSDNTPYQIMFGPDICGANNSQTHAIFYYERKLSYMHHVEKLQVKYDKLTHLYTLWIRSDNSYEFFIDKDSKSTGNIDRGKKKSEKIESDVNFMIVVSYLTFSYVLIYNVFCIYRMGFS